MDKFGNCEWETFLSIADTFVASIKGDQLKALIKDASVDAEELGQLCPSTLPGFKETVKNSLLLAPSRGQLQLYLTLRLLNNRATAVVFTGSSQLFKEMSIEERENVLLSWRDSTLTPFQKLFRSLYSVCISTYIRINPLLHRAMGHPMVEPRLASIVEHPPRYDILDFGRYSTAAQFDVDVVVVGSGSGAGVVANKLTQSGHTVLVVDRGVYYHQSELQFDENDAYRKLYEQSAVLQTDDNSISILAGATLGGGSTVNWSASLRTPKIVRAQWGQRVGWYNSDVYDKAMDYVMDKMGCSTDHIEHSFSNQIIMNGAAKLGYEAKEIPQNTGNASHNCAYCSHGCAFSQKQGSVVCWLREAVDTGRCHIIDQCEVRSITKSSKNKASGVNAIVTKDGREIRLTVRSKKVVSSCGSLLTPLLLHHSGFRNRHIGKGLKLHPGTAVFGEYPDHELNLYKNSIMTAVCTEFDNMDGKGHGPKIETLIPHPMFEYTLFPWRNGADLRKDLLRYNNIAPMAILTRDRSHGTISYRAETPLVPKVNYQINKFDCQALLQGCIGAADLIYIQGGRRIIVPIPTVPIFVTEKPVPDRDINDRDYQLWVSKLKQAVFSSHSTPIGTAHQMSSCRMSDLGPKYSALDGKGRLWECPNVFVADASVLPSAPGVNPMVSTMASAHVIAGYIDEALQKQTSSKL